MGIHGPDEYAVAENRDAAIDLPATNIDAVGQFAAKAISKSPPRTGLKGQRSIARRPYPSGEFASEDSGAAVRFRSSLSCNVFSASATASIDLADSEFACGESADFAIAWARSSPNDPSRPYAPSRSPIATEVLGCGDACTICGCSPDAGSAK